MEHVEFKVGDRVKALKDFEGASIQGLSGTIKTLDGKPLFGVEWDSPMEGHGGGYHFQGKKGQCWYVPQDVIHLIDENDIKNENEGEKMVLSFKELKYEERFLNGYKDFLDTSISEWGEDASAEDREFLQEVEVRLQKLEELSSTYSEAIYYTNILFLLEESAELLKAKQIYPYMVKETHRRKLRATTALKTIPKEK